MYKRWMSLLLLSYLLLFFNSSAHAAEPNGSDAVGDDISFVMPLNTVRTIDHPSFTINGLTKGDFNGDGKLDLVGTGIKQRTSDLDNGFVYLSLGNGDGSFQGAAQLRPLSVLIRGYPTDPGTYCPIARDFNGDGKLDIATAANKLKTVAVMLGRGDGSFQPQVITTTFPSKVGCINAADLNGDTVLDIVARSDDKKIMVAFGTGTGGFQTPVSYDAHSPLNGVSLGDVNNDGKVDIVYHGWGETKFGLMLNNGSGAFPAAPQQISIGGGMMMLLALADYTGDGKLDVFATGNNCNLGGPTCFYGVLVQGNGNGTFQTPPTANYIDGLLNNDILDTNGDNVPPDLNNDGKPDVVIFNNNGENNLTTLLSTDGGFTNRRRWIAASGTSRATLNIDRAISGASVAGDFSGDGIADIAIARTSRDTPGGISLILGKGNGEFASPRMVEDGFSNSAGQIRSLALADFTGDGKLDLLNIAFGSPVLQPGIGNGTFITSGLTTAPGGSGTNITVGDIDGNGKLDFVSRAGDARPIIGINSGSGTFSTTVFRTPATGHFGNYSNQTQALGDFNGDGKLDLALRNAAGVEVFLYPFPTDPNIDNTPFFTLTLTPIDSIDSSNNPRPSVPYAGDLDGDGKVDLLTYSINGANDNLQFFKGNGNGTFGAGVGVGSGYGGITNMFLRDLDGDGKPDLLTFGNTIYFAKGLGDGSFFAPAKIADNYGSNQAQLADFNSDGKPDIVATTFAYGGINSGIMVFAGKGDGTFGAPIYLPQGSNGLTGVLAGDVNGDGKPDIIPAYYSGGGSRFLHPVLINNSGPHVDLAMDMKASRNLVGTNTPVRFIATITNTGGSTATAVTLRSLLPASAWTFESAVASQGSCSNASGVVSCVVGAMPFSTTQVVTITARPLVDGQLAATASVSSTLADPDLGDNGAAATVFVATTPPWVSTSASGGSIPTATGSVSSNTNGKPVVRMARARRSPITVKFSMNKLNLPGVKSSNVKTTLIKVHIDYARDYDMVETVTSDSTSDWGFTIPGEDLVTNPVVIVVIICGTTCGDGDDVIVEWPWFDVELYDPSGIVSDKATGAPIEGATVTLYKVSGALPDEGNVTKQCRTIDTRPGGTGGNWESLPAATLANGVQPDLLFDPGEISPVINPQKTNSIGYYGWNVAKGCWFIKVEATGYKTVISPLVGVPPAVTDLNIKMEPVGGAGNVYLPLVTK